MDVVLKEDETTVKNMLEESQYSLCEKKHIHLKAKNLRDTLQRSPLVFACMKGNLSIVKLLVEHAIPELFI